MDGRRGCRRKGDSVGRVCCKDAHWDVGGRRSQPRVSLSALSCDAITGRRDSAFYIRVATSLRTLLSPE